MSKAMVGLVALGALGGLAFLATRDANASSNPDGSPASGAFVTGASGTVYGLAKIKEESSGDGIVETWEVSDAHGPMLQFVQFQGDDSSRQMLALATGRNFTDEIVGHAVQDFGILTGV